MEVLKNRFGVIKEEQAKLRKEVKERTVGYILAAFGLVAAFAWNDAVVSLINTFFPKTGNELLIKFLYAFLVTVIIVVISVYLIKPTEK